MDSGFLGTLLKSFLYYSLYVVMGRAVSRVIFAPYNEKWRLVNVDNSKAKRLTSAFYFSVTMIGIMSFLVHIVTVHNYPIELLTYMMAMSSAVKAFCIILITKRVLWDDIVVADSSAEETGSATLLPNDDQLSTASEDDGEVNSDDNSFRLMFFISLFSFGAFVISLFVPLPFGVHSEPFSAVCRHCRHFDGHPQNVLRNAASHFVASYLDKNFSDASPDYFQNQFLVRPDY